MKKSIIIIIIFFLCYDSFGQEKGVSSDPIIYGVGLSYNQIWLQSNLYGIDETDGSVSSSPFNWGITPCFSIGINRWHYIVSCSYLSFSRKTQYSKTRVLQDKWQEASLASAVGFRVTGERSLIKIMPYLGLDLTYLINYEKDIAFGSYTMHYDTEQLGARNPYGGFSYYFGLGLFGGISVSYPIAKHFEIGLSYCAKFKLINNIRNDSNPHYPASITSPVLYHNANIGFLYYIND